MNIKSYLLYKNNNSLFLKYLSKHILPKEYKQVEYIESTGTQYINTGFIPDNNTTYNLNASITSSTPRVRYIISAGKGSFRNNLYVNASYKLSAGYGDTYYNDNTLAEVNTKYNFILDKNLFYVDNQLLKTFNEQSFNNDTNVLIFGRNDNDTIVSYDHIRLYNCKIYDNDVLVRDFIPCYRKSDNIPGLYDLVNNVFYTKKGAGNFIIGKRV